MSALQSKRSSSLSSVSSACYVMNVSPAFDGVNQSLSHDTKCRRDAGIRSRFTRACVSAVLVTFFASMIVTVLLVSGYAGDVRTALRGSRSSKDIMAYAASFIDILSEDGETGRVDPAEGAAAAATGKMISGGHVGISTKTRAVFDRFVNAASGRLGSYCTVNSQKGLRPEWKFVWCNFEVACLSGSSDQNLLIFPPEESRLAVQGVQPAKGRVTVVDDEDVSEVEGLRGGAEERRLEVEEVLTWNELVSEGGVGAEGAGKRQFFEDVTLVTDGPWREFAKGKDVVWLDGVAVAAGKGVNWQSYAHRLQPYFDALKAWNVRGGAVDRIVGDGKVPTASPDAIFLLREDLDTEIVSRIVRPLLGRKRKLVSVDEFVARHTGGANSTYTASAVGASFLPRPADFTNAISAEAVARIEQSTNQDTLVCVRDVAYSMPYTGSQYAPLTVDEVDIDRLHRRNALDFKNEELSKIYAKGPIPRHDWLEPCQITIVNRVQKSRRISNVPELVETIRKFISSRALTGAEDQQLLSVVEETWEGGSQKDYERMVLQAARSCIVIMPHGAGIINAMHMRPGALLIELNPARYYWPRMKISIAQMGVETSALWLDEGEESALHHSSTVLSLAADNEKRNNLLLDFGSFKVSPDKVLGVIENYLLSRMDKRVYEKYSVVPPNGKIVVRTKHVEDMMKARKRTSIKKVFEKQAEAGGSKISDAQKSDKRRTTEDKAKKPV